MALQFIEDRLSVEIGYGSSFSESYPVDRHYDAGGNTYAHLIDPRPKCRCELIFQNRSFKFTLLQVKDLFHRSGGTFGGFRVKNYLDYSTNEYVKPPTAFDQGLRKTATPGVYQITRWFGLPVEISTRRLIKKPVPGTVKVAKNGVELVSGWTVDITSGLITFDPVPAVDDVLTAGCYYDIPMQFETDLSGIDVTDVDMLSISVSLIELLNP